ncbi:hypothetical protein Tco_0617772 [Tanacetum coccineum]
MAVRTQPTLSPGYSAKLTKAMAPSPSSFRKRYISSYETPLSSLSLASSPTLLSRKRYRGTSELIADTKTESDESEDEGTNSKDEEMVSESQQQQTVLAEDTAKDEPLGLDTLAPATTLDEDALLEIGAQLELHGKRVLEETGINMGTLWRLMLALEAWAGYTDTHIGALWQSIYEDQQEIYDLRRQHATNQREIQELTDRIAALEQRTDS